MSRQSALKRSHPRPEEQMAAEIASDPKVLRDIAAAVEDIKNGNTVSLEEAFGPTQGETVRSL